jgi:hypothetical protein
MYLRLACFLYPKSSVVSPINASCQCTTRKTRLSTPVRLQVSGEVVQPIASALSSRHERKEAPLSDVWAGLMRLSFSSAGEGATGGNERGERLWA